MNHKEQIIHNLQTKKIHVMGVAGIEGSDIALFLDKIKAPKENITLHQLSPEETFKENFFKYNQGFSDTELQERFQKLINSGFKFNFDKDYLNNIQDADIIYAPQSWFMHTTNQPLFDLKDKISTITNLYFQLIPCPIVAITGSNGKSTTTKITYELLNQSSKHKAWITGNDRSTPSLLLKLDQISPEDILITETSNRQLNFLSNHKPFISIVTNITENHISEYNDFQDYINAKLKIYENQSSKDHLIINIDNPILKDLKNLKPTVHTTSLTNQSAGAYIKDEKIIYKDEEIIPISELNIIGPHNHSNILQAVTAAKIIGIDNSQIRQTLQNFYGLKDRCEIVHRSNNMTFINDRQGTSVDSTINALKSLPEPVLLIFGGANKGMHTDVLASNMSTPGTINIGIESPFTDELKEKLPKDQFIKVKSLTEAIQVATNLASKEDKPVHILFSPACEYGPYFNPLPGYNDAESFNQIVKQY